MRASIETENVVAEPFQNIEEESAPAAKIKDILARHSMQSEVLHAFAIEAQVMIHISVLREPARHFSIARLDFAQSRLIEVGHNRAKRQGKEVTSRAPPGTLVSDRVCQFADLMDNDHEANVSISICRCHLALIALLRLAVRVQNFTSEIIRCE